MPGMMASMFMSTYNFTYSHDHFAKRRWIHGSNINVKMQPTSVFRSLCLLLFRRSVWILFDVCIYNNLCTSHMGNGANMDNFCQTNVKHEQFFKWTTKRYMPSIVITLLLAHQTKSFKIGNEINSFRSIHTHRSSTTLITNNNIICCSNIGI